MLLLNLNSIEGQTYRDIAIGIPTSMRSEFDLMFKASVKVCPYNSYHKNYQKIFLGDYSIIELGYKINSR